MPGCSHRILAAPDADAGGVCMERHRADGSQWVNECTLLYILVG